jgi:hypothetical protein
MALMSKPDDICGSITDSIDDLLTSVDAMRWTPPPTAGSAGDLTSGTSTAWMPTDCKERFDALYETIDDFAGAVNDRMDTFANRIEQAFGQSPGPRHRLDGDDPTGQP